MIQALNGPNHHIRELQATRGLGDNPIDALEQELKATQAQSRPVFRQT